MRATEFEYILTQYQSELRAHAIQLTKNSDHANDLVQETCLRALRYRKSYRADACFSAWLHTILRNTFLSQYQQNRRRQGLLLQAPEGSLVLEADREVNPSEDTSWIEHLVAQLPVGLRTALFLYIRGYAYHEIADIMGVPLGTIKNRIHRARSRLRTFTAPVQVA
ncbi:MAG: RNA polymerase sigma factor [Bacteroidota bacterium]